MVKNAAKKTNCSGDPPAGPHSDVPFALPDAPGCSTGGTRSITPLASHAACACLVHHRRRGIWFVGDSLTRDFAQMLAGHLVADGGPLDWRTKPELVRRLRCSKVGDMSGFASDIKYAPALSELYDPQIELLRARFVRAAASHGQAASAAAAAAVQLISVPSMPVCGGKATIVYHPLKDLTSTREVGGAAAALARGMARGSPVPVDVLVLGAGLHTAALVPSMKGVPRTRQQQTAWLSLYNNTLRRLLAGHGRSQPMPRLIFAGYSSRQIELAPEWVQQQQQGADLLDALNRVARVAVESWGGSYLDLFCTSALEFGRAGATLDGLHYNDRVNWRKAQALLADLCAPGAYKGGRTITVTHTATHRVQDLFHS